MEGFGTYEGRAAVRGVLEDWLAAYDEFRADVEEIRDLGARVTFGVLVMRGRLRGSTGWVQLRFGSVGVWADGIVERGTNYTDIDEARAAAERVAEERG